MRSVLLAFLVLLVAAPPAAAGRADYLRAAQNRDGGFPMAPGQASGDLATGWAALGLAAAGHNPLDVRRRSGRSVVDFLRARLPRLRAVGDVERTILVVGAAGLDPRRFGGRNLVAEVLRRRERDGSIAGYVSYTSFGVMALRAGGHSTSSGVVRAAAAWLGDQQNRDGGFNFRRRGGPSGIDDTAAAVQALAAAGRGRGPTAQRAARFLRARQQSSGGFGLMPGAPANAQSTAYAVQAFVAAGVPLARVTRSGRSPLDYLASLTERSGRVRYSRTSAQTPVWVTAQVLAAMARKPFPLRPVRRR